MEGDDPYLLGALTLGQAGRAAMKEETTQNLLRWALMTIRVKASCHLTPRWPMHLRFRSLIFLLNGRAIHPNSAGCNRLHTLCKAPNQKRCFELHALVDQFRYNSRFGSNFPTRIPFSFGQFLQMEISVISITWTIINRIITGTALCSSVTNTPSAVIIYASLFYCDVRAITAISFTRRNCMHNTT